MKPTSFAAALCLLGTLLESALCWGNLGHRTAVLLSEMYLTAQGTAYVKRMLKGDDIAEAAIWADQYKQTPEGQYTSSWHFVDVKDSPPDHCDVIIERDCSAQRTCIITAISNMTERLTNANLNFEARHEAFKFILHLLGDLHNPLHAESIARGGNDISVLFYGIKTNLHFVWDVSIPQKLTASNERGEADAARAWARKLYKHRKETDKSHSEQDIVHVSESSILYANTEELESVLLTWSRESSQWICRYVLARGLDYIQDKELGQEYYEGAVPIVESLISKAGRRVAMWISMLADRERLTLQEL